MDYVENIFPDFQELHGDRLFGDDAALICGTATWEHQRKKVPVMIIGHQKGRTTKQKVRRNFGMARPEGYHKAIRMFEMAERFRMPVITFIDTPGAYPGMDAETRTITSDCRKHTFDVFFDRSTCSIVIGEGGSGGALAIGNGNEVYMQEFSTYSVISPESCASILWSDSTLAEKAAERLKITAKDLDQMKLVDQVIPEPNGGAHRDSFIHQTNEKNRRRLSCFLFEKDFSNPTSKESKTIQMDRISKFRKMGDFAIRDIGSKGATK